MNCRTPSLEENDDDVLNLAARARRRNLDLARDGSGATSFPHKKCGRTALRRPVPTVPEVRLNLFNAGLNEREMWSFDEWVQEQSKQIARIGRGGE